MKSKKWYARIRYPDGLVKRVPCYEDKVASQAKLKELLTDAERTDSGVRDRFGEHRKRSLAEHLEDFRRYLAAKGNTEIHVAHTYMRAKAVIDGCKFRYTGDLSHSRVTEFLAELRKTKGVSVATSNYYAQSVKAFATWLVKDQRAPDNPLAHLSRQNAKADVRVQRRSLPPADFDAFIAAARGGGPVCGLSGSDRAILYLVATNTGFRAAELASLTPESFDLAGNPPAVDG